MDNSVDMENPYAPTHYRETSCRKQMDNSMDNSINDDVYNYRRESYMNTIQSSHHDKDSTERGGSLAPKSRREIFEQQRENFRRKSREMRKSVEKCKANEVATKLCTISHKEPVLAFNTRNKNCDIDKKFSWMNTQDKGVKMGEKQSKIIEAGKNGKSLFLENLAKTENQRKAQDESIVQETKEGDDYAENQEKKRKSKKRKSSKKKCKRANSSIVQEPQQDLKAESKQFGKFFEDEALQLHKAVSNVGRDQPKDHSRKESSKKLNIKKKKSNINLDEDVTEKENDAAQQPKAKRRHSRKICHNVGEEADPKSKAFTGMRSIIDDLESSINQIFTKKNEDVEKENQDINEEEEIQDNQGSISAEEECNNQVENLKNVEQNNINNAEAENENCDLKAQDSIQNKNINSSSTERDEEVHSNESSENSPTPQTIFINEISDPNIELSYKINMLTRAVPKEAGPLKLTIVRKKSGLARFSPKFYLYDENKTTFLLNSKKKIANQTSNYLISVEEGVFNKNSYTFIGKVRSNHKKNKYIIYDNGENIEKNKKVDPNLARCELGYVSFTQGRKNLPGHRSLEYIIPEINSEGVPFKFQPTNSKESMVEKYTGISFENMIVFENQIPYWNEDKKNYVMMFSDRVKESSVKNFQLKRKEGEVASAEDEIFLEFGKINKTDFSLTLKWPFSILNAFGLALSSFDL